MQTIAFLALIIGATSAIIALILFLYVFAFKREELVHYLVLPHSGEDS